MNWVRELCDLYEKNKDSAGKVETGRYGEDVILLPVFHTTVKAQITVTLTPDGEFYRADRVSGDDSLTVIPVTDESASRTAGIAANPLCDNLKYLAGDYMEYVISDKDEDNTQYHRLYMEGLKRWAESEQSHEKVRAVYAYLLKNELMKDLFDSEVLIPDVDGKIRSAKYDDKKDEKKAGKIEGIRQAAAFVRFVIGAEGEKSKCWLDNTLHDAYIRYCRASAQEKGISYLTGETGAISYLQPKKIRSEGDSAKLISSNDESGFTYRGRFNDKTEAFAIGYEDSQKIHNALKWIIRKQGKTYGGLSVVTWESDLNKLPDWSSDTDSICEEYESWDDEKEQKQQYEGTDSKTAARFLAAMNGYHNILIKSPEKINSNVMIMAFDAATPGRLSVAEAAQLSSSAYLDSISRWHEDCKWKQIKYKNKAVCKYEGVPSVKGIAELLYGTEENGGLVLKGSNDKRKPEICNRLRPCIIYGRPVPQDMVNLAVRRASAPESFDSELVWKQVLGLACSLVKKKESEKGSKEVWSVELNTESCDRSYLYGRLLAAADMIERQTYGKDEKRVTNAMRLMNAFSKRPYSTWKIIEEHLTPYLDKLKDGERAAYSHLLDRLCQKFGEGEFENKDALSGLYLLGYHSQSLDFYRKSEENSKEAEPEASQSDERSDRSYLYGRLLATADRIEYRTYDRDEARQTNAKQLMSSFSLRPFRIWQTIEERVQPYMAKLKTAERIRYEKLLNEIFGKFSEGDFEKEEPLDGLYLLGFHKQSYNFNHFNDKSKEEKEND
ncbi:MAG: type I-C CRISPR-associated protein Cas8c/Csd1 [Oscillospiraceae bacterium]|nr:type I-C CRISPR-associated protein Cas8c/Csd1 [Oscillospiraceae bacterium]